MGDLREAVASGDRTKALLALRDELARDIENAPCSAVAPLAKQLRDVLTELETLRPKQGASKVDDLAARRAKRRSDTAHM